MSNLRDRVVIITGAAGYIGRAYCKAFAGEGAKIVAADLIETDAIVKELRELGAEAAAVKTDITSLASTEAMAKAAHERFGRIDAIINNAGFYTQSSRVPWTDISDSEWDLAHTVNVKGLWYCCKAVYPYMKAQKYGKIVNIGSNTVWRGVPTLLHYVSSKSALIGLTRALAREVGDDGICVNLLAPDLIPAPEYLKSNPGNNEFVVQQRILKRTQIPEDMVGLALLLASPDADFVTGQSFLINGGSYFN
jgi:NAD(P)-dependent dehydrogenase (short-subunit alcohol dehydrogenase family)